MAKRALILVLVLIVIGGGSVIVNLPWGAINFSPSTPIPKSLTRIGGGT